MRARPALALLVLALAASPGLAAKIVVPKDQPTIQAAIDAAANGDVIVVKKGVYAENLLVLSITDLTIRGKSGAVVDGTIGGSPTLLFSSADGLVLEGLTFRNDASSGITSNGNSERVTVRDCRFLDVEGTALDLDDEGSVVVGNVVKRASVGIDCRGPSCLVADNVVRETISSGIFIGGDRSVVRDNEVVDAGVHGIGTLLGTTDLVVRDNTIRGAGADGIRLFSACDRATVEGNRIEDAAADGVRSDGAGSSLSGNTVLRPGQDGIALHGPNHRVVGNKIAEPGRHGMHLVTGTGADLNTIDGNVVKKAGVTGYRVDGDANTFTRNRAKKGKPGPDVLDTGVANVYLDNDLVIL